MGYSIKDYGNAFLVLLGIKAEQIMTEKADKTREGIRMSIIDGRDWRCVVVQIIAHAKANYDYWERGAVAQVAAIYKTDKQSAIAMIAEMSETKLDKSNI